VKQFVASLRRKDGELDIDEALRIRTRLIDEIRDIDAESAKLRTTHARNCANHQRLDRLNDALKAIAFCATARNENEALSSKSAKISKSAKSKEATRRALLETLEGLDEELHEFANPNVYGSPSQSRSCSVSTSQNFDAMAMVSADSAHCAFDEKSAHQLAQYLQDFLPLAMRKEIEGLRVKALSRGFDEQIEAELERMKAELQSDALSGSAHSQFVRHPRMDTFDEFDKLDIKMSLLLSDIPEAIRALLQRTHTAQHIDKFFAIV